MNKKDTEEQAKKALWDSWSYEFEAWISKLQSAPVELVISKDNSESYQMDRRHIFKLENGQYAFIREEGCSCYEARKANIELVPNLKEAKRLWNEASLNDYSMSPWKHEMLN